MCSLTRGPLLPSLKPEMVGPVFLTQYHSDLASVITSPSLTLFFLPPSSTFKDPCDYIGQLISNLNSICNFNTPLPCNLI